MKHLIYILSFLLLTLAPVGRVCAEVTTADGHVLTEVQLDSLRQTEDFVKASLVVTDPGEVLYSMLGHACLHVECPTFGLDYIYTYESELVEDKIIRFLKGDLKMGMFPVQTEEFLHSYQEEGRGVREYELNLTPTQKGNLWRVLDEHVAKGSDIPYDYFERGCARMIINIMHEALDRTKIDYPEWPKKYKNSTLRELGQLSITKAKNEKLISEKSAYWNTVFMYALMGNDGDKDYPCEKKLIVPNDLVEMWQQATVNGETLLSAEPNNLCYTQPKNYHPCWISPTLVASLLLIFSLIGWWTEWQWITWLILVATTTIGTLMTYLLFFSSLPCTNWSWLIIPFNILPIIVWHWRRYWSTPYAMVVLLWVMGMISWPHKIVDTAYLIIAMAFVVVLLIQSKDKITNIITKIKIQKR